MERLRYSPAARAGLAKITRDIIENNGELVAERVVAKLEISLSHAAEYPGVGWKRPGLVDIALGRCVLTSRSIESMGMPSKLSASSTESAV
jgi:plasmid stabilization system protein ParE